MVEGYADVAPPGAAGHRYPDRHTDIATFRHIPPRHQLHKKK